MPDSLHIETLTIKGFEANGLVLPDETTMRSLKRMTAETNFISYPFNPDPHLLNVKNGVVRFPDMAMKPHSCKHLFDYQIITPYVDCSGGTPEFDKYANEWGCGISD